MPYFLATIHKNRENIEGKEVLGVVSRGGEQARRCEGAVQNDKHNGLVTQEDKVSLTIVFTKMLHRKSFMCRDELNFINLM